MLYEIVLFDRARAQVGVIRFDSTTKEIILDWDKGHPNELSDALTSLLKTIHEKKSLKARHEIIIEGEEGKVVRVQKMETISTGDASFIAALADRINRSAEFKSKLFAVVKKS